MAVRSWRSNSSTFRANASRWPVVDGAVDAVVSAFTLCAIPGVGDAFGGSPAP
jgi:hypothetical protein